MRSLSGPLTGLPSPGVESESTASDESSRRVLVVEEHSLLAAGLELAHLQGGRCLIIFVLTHPIVSVFDTLKNICYVSIGHL